MQRILLSAATLAAVVLAGADLQAQQSPSQRTAQTPSGSSQAPATQSTAPGSSAGASALPTDKDKLSYAIGMNIGTTLQRQSIDVDPAVVARGVQDALAGKTLLSDDEARGVLEQLQQKMQMEQQQKLEAAAAKNKQEGDAYLAANKAKEGVVTLPSGLEYKILRAGTGPKPAASDTVLCNYEGKLIDGKVFDSSYQRGQPLAIPVSRVIKGFTEALQLMPVGSKWELVIPPDLAYGPRGAGADIGPNATLVFDVEVLSIQPPQNNPSSLPAPGSPAPGSAPNSGGNPASGTAPGAAGTPRGNSTPQ